MLITDPRWIPWSLETDGYAVVKLADEAVTDLRIDLEDCLEPASVLDRLVRAEQDYGGGTAGALLRLLCDVLELSHTICPFGKPASLGVTQMHLMVDAYVRRSGVHD